MKTKKIEIALRLFPLVTLAFLFGLVLGDPHAKIWVRIGDGVLLLAAYIAGVMMWKYALSSAFYSGKLEVYNERIAELRSRLME